MKKDNIFDLIIIDESKTVPKYKQLQLEIERLIMENLLPVNKMLPGENAFFKWLGLSSRLLVRLYFARSFH
jgi:DNA-binding transcriptional regulator YhcF (GntR family)